MINGFYFSGRFRRVVLGDGKSELLPSPKARPSIGPAQLTESTMRRTSIEQSAAVLLIIRLAPTRDGILNFLFSAKNVIANVLELTLSWAPSRKLSPLLRPLLFVYPFPFHLSPASLPPPFPPVPPQILSPAPLNKSDLARLCPASVLDPPRVCCSNGIAVNPPHLTQ